MKDQPTTKIITSLSASSALCTFADAIKNTEITGHFGDFLYCMDNGRQVFLDHANGGKLATGTLITYNCSVFITKQDGLYKKHVQTWEELRQYLSEGWVLGTDRKQGIKVNFPDSGQNNRLQPEKIYLLQK
jgi:hypothetical protein